MIDDIHAKPQELLTLNIERSYTLPAPMISEAAEVAQQEVLLHQIATVQTH